MVNCYKHAIDSIESVQKIARGSSDTPLRLNERQCQFVAQELAQIRVFLENRGFCLKLGQDIRHFILLHLCSAVERAKLLVKKCCCKDSESWLVAAMTLVEIQEEFATIILDVHLWRTLLDTATTSAAGSSHEKKAEQLMVVDEEYHRLSMKMRKENHALRQAALEDKRIFLSRIAEVHGSQDDLEYLRAIYLQSLLTHAQAGTGNVGSTDMMLNKYKDLHVLGKGGCGTVFEVTWLGVGCALKILNVQDEREATALKGLFHPNIIRLFHYWEAPPHNPKSHLLMELMPTDLGVYIEGRLKNMSSSAVQTGKGIMPFSLPVAIDIMHQIAQAVQYLHGRHLSHRDLKPSNILVKERENAGLTRMDGEGYLDIKLADFGLVKVYENTSTTQGHTVNTGTPLYGAPEIFGKDLALERNLLPMADVWSFGITCAEILSGKKPYADEPRGTLQRRIFKEGLRPTLPKDCPQYLAFCISSCWELLPERRPDFASICKLLRHARLLSLGVTDLEDSKLFFAYTTRSGYVKSLSELKTSKAERFSTFFHTCLEYLGLKHLTAAGQHLIGSTSESTILPHEVESMISNSFAINHDCKSSAVGLSTEHGLLLQDDCDVDKGGDPLRVILDDARLKYSSNVIPEHLMSKGHKSALEEWERKSILLTAGIERKRKQGLHQRNEIYYLVGFFSVFQGSILTAVPQSNLLHCDNWWNPFMLSVLVSLVMFFKVWQRFNFIWSLDKSIFSEETTLKAVVKRINALRREGKNFQFASLEVRTSKKEEPSRFTVYTFLVFAALVSFAVVFAVSHPIMLCPSARTLTLIRSLCIIQGGVIYVLLDKGQNL